MILCILALYASYSLPILVRVLTYYSTTWKIFPFLPSLFSLLSLLLPLFCVSFLLFFRSSNIVALTILLIRTHYTTLLLLHLIMNLHTDKLFLLCSFTIMPTQTNNMCQQAMMLEERFEWASKNHMNKM